MSSINRRAFLGSTSLLVGATCLNRSPAKTLGDDVETSALGKTPHTRFAANIEMWWTKQPMLDRIKQAAAFGYPAIEFWPWRGKDIDAIGDLCSQLGLEIAQFTAWGFVPGMNNPSYQDKFVKEVEASCEVAKKLRCKKMTVVAGNDQRGMTQEEMHQHVIAALKKAAPVAEANKVMLILEPMNIRVDHKGHCLYGSTAAVRICREVNSPMVKINWDLYHMQISEGDLCGHLREGFDQVGYLQLADHPGRNEPGTGEIHYNRVLKQAHELGYRDYVGLELKPKTTELAAAQAVAAADVW